MRGQNMDFNSSNLPYGYQFNNQFNSGTKNWLDWSIWLFYCEISIIILKVIYKFLTFKINIILF
jgi:hypothetical protein